MWSVIFLLLWHPFWGQSAGSYRWVEIVQTIKHIFALKSNIIPKSLKAVSWSNTHLWYTLDTLHTLLLTGWSGGQHRVWGVNLLSAYSHPSYLLRLIKKKGQDMSYYHCFGVEGSNPHCMMSHYIWECVGAISQGRYQLQMADGNLCLWPHSLWRGLQNHHFVRLTSEGQQPTSTQSFGDIIPELRQHTIRTRRSAPHSRTAIKLKKQPTKTIQNRANYINI